RSVMGDRRGGETTDLDEVRLVGFYELLAASLRRWGTEKAAALEELRERPHGRGEADVVLRILRREADKQGGCETPDTPNATATQRPIDPRQLLHATTDRDSRVSLLSEPRDEVVDVRPEQRQGREATVNTWVQLNQHRGPPCRNDRANLPSPLCGVRLDERAHIAANGGRAPHKQVLNMSRGSRRRSRRSRRGPFSVADPVWRRAGAAPGRMSA